MALHRVVRVLPPAIIACVKVITLQAVPSRRLNLIEANVAGMHIRGRCIFWVKEKAEYP